MQASRRDFLRTTAALAATPLMAAEQPAWFDKPMRWAQVVFTEDDPGNYDPSFWFDYFKRTHSGGACLAGGGCMAFYPTKIPLHYKSKFLGNRDPFGEMVEGCRKLGMNVIARTDPHAAHQDVYDAHPDWIAVDAQGRKRRHWANPELWVTCALGPYNFDFMTQVTKEIVSLYKVDGVFSNRWAGSGQCFCEHCQTNFKKFSGGLDLPRTANPQDPARRQYILWNQHRLFELWRLWDAEIKKLNPNAAFIANSGGGATSALDMKTIGELAPILFADRQARRGLMTPWSNGKNGKEYRSTMGRKPIGGIFSIGLEEPYRWKDSVQSGEEIRVWVADGIAQGLRPWFAKFNAKPYDKRWMPVVEDIYKWHYKNERYLRNEANLARIGMVYSQQTAHFYGSKVEEATNGFYHALVEARLPFEMVHDGLLDAERLRPFKTLVLPNIAALSDSQCAQLRAFVQQGGSIVATHETSLYDEWGVRRGNFGLADLFGCTFNGKVDGPVQNSYLNIDDPAHPLTKGLDDAPRIIHGVNQVRVKPSIPFKAPITEVPSYPDLPMEDVYPRVAHTDSAGVYSSQHGNGRVVYFPWDIDRTFWEVLSPDHGKLLRNAVSWAANEPAPIEVSGPGLIDIALWSQKSSLAAHLVNLTNPMAMKGPYREVIPIGPIQVRIRVEHAPKSVRLLVLDKAAPFQHRGGFVEVQVPSIGVHEVVAIDL